MTLWFEVDWVKYPNPEFQPVSSLGHCLDSVLAYLNNEEEKYIPPDDIPDMSIRSPVKTIRVYDDRSKPPDVINFGVPKPFNEIVSIKTQPLPATLSIEQQLQRCHPPLPAFHQVFRPQSGHLLL